MPSLLRVLMKGEENESRVGSSDPIKMGEQERERGGEKKRVEKKTAKEDSRCYLSSQRYSAKSYTAQLIPISRAIARERGKQEERWREQRWREQRRERRESLGASLLQTDQG